MGSSGCHTGIPFSKMYDATFRFAPLSPHWSRDSALIKVSPVYWTESAKGPGSKATGEYLSVFFCFGLSVSPF